MQIGFEKETCEKIDFNLLNFGDVFYCVDSTDLELKCFLAMKIKDIAETPSVLDLETNIISSNVSNFYATEVLNVILKRVDEHG